MQYSVCCVPVSALRREPAHTSEITSQQLFGECCSVVESIHQWKKIKCKYDDYEGWCQASHVVDIEDAQFHHSITKLTSRFIDRVIYNGKKMMVPLGSSISTFKKHKAQWQGNSCIFDGEINIPSKEKITKKSIKSITGKFLNTPYLWGGKSVFGIDCSGFTQSVYKFLDIYLPRDSCEQAGSGVSIELLEASCGDLCFFDNEEGRIVHVGLLLNQHQIIHSSGKVRIDKIDQQGITNIDTGERTHSMKLIRRYFELT